jgi:hypothetical protein
MLNRALEVIKNNAILVILYLSFVLASSAITLVFNPNDMSTMDTNMAFIKILSFLGIMLFMGVCGMVFLAGLGNMLAEAVETGITRIESFLPGIKKFVGRLFLLILITIALYVVFSIFFGVVIAITMGIAFVLIGSSQEVMNIFVLGGFGIVALLIVFLTPFVMLMMPAMFINDLGIIEAFKTGIRAGKNNYGKLILSFFAITIPSFVFSIFNVLNTIKVNTNTSYDPTNIGFSIFNGALNLYVLTLLFLIYKEWRDKNFKVEESYVQIEN